MTHPSAAIRRVRRARRRADATPRDFDRYRPEYEAALRGIRDLAGDPAIDDLVGWIVEVVGDDGRLPPPKAIRERARALCAERGVAVPADSALWD